MASKKNKKSSNNSMLVIIVFLIVGFLIGVAGAYLYNTVDLRFYLLGDAEINIGLGEDYVEKGYICEYKGVDYSSDVVVNYYNQNQTVVSEIISDEAKTYYIVYSINNDYISASITRIVNVVEVEDLEINFIMFDSNNAGDCIYIKAGETDILIDAGAKRTDATGIYNYLIDDTSTLHQSVTDNKLEYVIATHAHEDHIASFVGETNKNNGILHKFDVDVIIDFPKTNSNSKIYNDYKNLVKELEKEGTNHYTALDCYNNVNGANRVIKIAAGIELEILYNYYYENETDNENNYSVCVMIHRGETKFLLTGDLEGKGEEYLVDNNNLGEVYLYKLGHHGSKTSSSDKLLSTIKPQVAVATCAAFTKEYTNNTDNQFPTKAAIDNLAKYKVGHLYVSKMLSKDADKFENQQVTPANGHIVAYANKLGVGIRCSNSNEDFYNFDIFKQYRSWTTK